MVGVVGPLNSECAQREIPLENRAPRGPLALISPFATGPFLTRSAVGDAAKTLGAFYAAGPRNFFRTIGADHIQVTADAVFVKRLGATRVAVVYTDSGMLQLRQEQWFVRAARRLGIAAVPVLWSTDQQAVCGCVEGRPCRRDVRGLIRGRLNRRHTRARTHSGRCAAGPACRRHGCLRPVGDRQRQPCPLLRIARRPRTRPADSGCRAGTCRGDRCIGRITPVGRGAPGDQVRPLGRPVDRTNRGLPARARPRAPSGHDHAARVTRATGLTTRLRFNGRSCGSPSSEPG